MQGNTFLTVKPIDGTQNLALRICTGKADEEDSAVKTCIFLKPVEARALIDALEHTMKGQIANATLIRETRWLND